MTQLPAGHTPPWSVRQIRAGYTPGGIYDINIAVLTHVRDGDPDRIRQFKRFGLLRLKGHKVHVGVISSAGDFECLQELSKGWPEGVDVTLLEMNSADPIRKINGYYLWLRQAKLEANWHLRVDDDSITDVDTALADLNDSYGEAAVHSATSYRTTEIGGPMFQTYLLEKGYCQSLFPHESESSFTSGKALKRIFESEPAMEMLAETAQRWGAPGDRALACAAHMAGVPVVKNPGSTADFRPRELTIFGGSLYHIHHVPWRTSRLLETLESRTAPQIPASTIVEPEARDRFLILFRPPDKIIELITLRSDSTIEGSVDCALSGWQVVNEEIQLRSKDGVIEHVFTEATFHGNRLNLFGFSATDRTPVWATELICPVPQCVSDPNNDAWSALPFPYLPWSGLSTDPMEIAAAKILCAEPHMYVRIGADSRPISFSPDGTIQLGAADNERIWNISRLGSQLFLTIGNHSAAICHLRLGKDGIWRGRWLAREMMHVAVFPEANFKST